MPNIAPLPPEDWTQQQSELLAPMQNNEGVGKIARNLLTTLIRHPNLFKRWTVFANHILFKSSLNVVERELAILRIAWLTQTEYEWGQHVLIARDGGLSDETIRRVKHGSTRHGWCESQSALLLAVDQLHANSKIDDDCWATLKEYFDERQLLDLIFTVGNYRMLAGAINSAMIERDPGVPGLDQP